MSRNKVVRETMKGMNVNIVLVGVRNLVKCPYSFESEL